MRNGLRWAKGLRRARLGPLLGLCFCAALTRAGSQATAPVAPSSQPYTLHVYEDLLQFPTLVLNTLHGNYHDLGLQDFSIRLDSGPAFHPSHLRIEGDDALNIALLLDAEPGQSDNLSDSIQNSVARLPADLFSPRDRVSIFAFDCNVIRSSLAASASIPRVTAEIGVALRDGGLHHARGSDRCKRHFGLWDAIGQVAQEIHDLPGRRVVLVLTEGKDTISTNSWEAVDRYASLYSIAIFALRPPVQPVDYAMFGIRHPGMVVIDFEEKLGLLCAGTGGLSLTASRITLEPMIRRIVGFLRNRYILEFPRPSNGEVGFHDIAVAVSDRTAIVRVTGLAFPSRDNQLLSDPSTVPADPSSSPVMGTRRIMPRPK